MKTIIKHKTKIITLGVALFALVVIFAALNVGSQKAQACTTDCFPPVSGYCTASVSEANIGETVTFSGQGSGGNGIFAYTWTGSDGLYGLDRTISKSYSTSGSKSATVQITSNGQSVYKTCNVVIRSGCANNCFPPVSGYCTASVSEANIGETVTFSGQGSGGNGIFAYTWTGSDGLYGLDRTISKSYSTSGSKSATVQITSNGQSVYKTCNVVIRSGCANNCFPPVSGYCTASVSEANIGETVTFSGQGSGGNGIFAYTWTGSDGLYGLDRTISKSYSTSGSKSATVQITSNGQSVYKTCNVFIRSPQVNNLNVYCVASTAEANIGDSVTFTAHPSGGSGNYSYSWSGTDGLSGNNSSVSKTYNTGGTKTATIMVTDISGSINQTRTATCSTFIRDRIIHNDIGGFCEGNPSSVDEDERVTWTAYPSGGNGVYEYDWSGDDNLNGSGKSITKRYSDSGTKEARVRITSDGQSVTKTCTVRVRSTNNNLDVYCVANRSTVDVNQEVTFTAYPSGSNSGNYRYSWSGTDNLNGSSKSVSKSYSNPGSKSARVKVTLRNSNGNDDEVTATCHTEVNGPAVIYTPPINPPTGVYLDTIPATGISTNVKTALFLTGTILWSAFLGYILIRRRNLKLKTKKMIDDAMNS